MLSSRRIRTELTQSPELAQTKEHTLGARERRMLD